MLCVLPEFSMFCGLIFKERISNGYLFRFKNNCCFANPQNTVLYASYRSTVPVKYL